MARSVGYLGASGVAAVAGWTACMSQPDWPFALLGLAMPFGLIGLAIFVVFRAWHDRTDVQLTVHEDGRMFVRRIIPGDLRRNSAAHQVDTDSLPVSALTGSTILPCLLLLRLHVTQGRLLTIPVFFDSLVGDEFKRLSVAVMWIASRNDPAQCEVER